MNIAAVKSGWMAQTALLGLIVAIVLIGIGTGGIGLLLLVPLAFVADVAILRGVKQGWRRLTRRRVD